MKFSVDWLKDFVEIKLPLSKLIAILNAKSFEVEEEEETGLPGKEYDKIFTAEVLSFEKHPNADRLRVVKVKVGSQTVFPVVCGADNFKVGDKVIFAFPGASVKDQHDTAGKRVTLRKAKIRGIESEGMILSAFEAGLGEDRTGIYLLPRCTKSGLAFHKYLQTQTKPKQKALHVDLVTTNRSDVVSHRGLAFEIATVTGGGFKKRTWPRELPAKRNAGRELRVNIRARQLCPRYIGAVLTGIKVGPAPMFIQNRLKEIGVKSINNIVDITNYVMAEYGNPLHAFDAAKLKGNQIIVRTAKRGEHLTTLDGEQRALQEGMLVIADAAGAIALAGVMGGIDTAVTESTASVVLESATFDGISVRSSARKLGMNTDASQRFAKNLPPKLAGVALARAVELLREYAGAKLVEVVEAGSYPKKASVIRLSISFLNDLLGVRLNSTAVQRLLALGGFEFQKKTKNELFVVVPWWRTDINIQEDLIEEVERLYGLDNIPEAAPNVLASCIPENPGIFWKDRLRDFFSAVGFFEAYNYSFVSLRDLELTDTAVKKAVQIENPQSDEQAFLRVDLLPNLLRTTGINLKNFEAVRLFEIGAVFEEGVGSVKERTLLGGVVAQRKKSLTDLFREAKGVLETLAVRYVTQPLVFAPVNSHSLFSQAVKISVAGELVGELGVLSPRLTSTFDINTPVVYFKLELLKLLPFLTLRKPYRQVSKFPKIVYDVSVVLDQKHPWEKIVKAVKEAASSDLQKVEFFDEFVGSGIPAGKRSLAFHLVFQSQKKTLKEEEVKRDYDNIIAALKTKFAAEVRE